MLGPVVEKFSNIMHVPGSELSVINSDEHVDFSTLHSKKSYKVVSRLHFRFCPTKFKHNFGWSKENYTRPYANVNFKITLMNCGILHKLNNLPTF